MLIAITAMFFTKNSLLSALVLLSFIASSMAATMLSSFALTKTILKGDVSSFVLELPPYRKPQFLKIIWQTVKEKVFFVLLRAVAVAAPAGLVIWVLANIKVGNSMLLNVIADFLDPLGSFMGLDGVILLAFILVTYLSTGELSDYSSLEGLKTILVDNGWTATTAICTCIFSMFHFPCSTTLLTIWKETKSVKWTALSVAVPLLLGFIVCALINVIF